MKMEDENYDYVSATIDEVALEGLDGITLSALWLRLQKRPRFTLYIDEYSKVFIWNFLSRHPDIEFYELAEARKPLVLFNRYDHLDLDVGVVVETPNIPEDIYPFSKVDVNGIRGSCATFHSRRNITEFIRNDESQLMDLQSVMNKWNEKLVLVASQDARNFALLGTETNPQTKLNILQYCMLERIGRSRYHGEVTQGKTGLSVLNESVKSLHYLRKLLMQKQLITKQLHYQRTLQGQTSSGGLLHLKRFYVERRSKMQLLLQNLSEKLCQKPNHREVFVKLRNELGVKENVYKKILQKASLQYVKVYTLHYREMYPNASKQEAFATNGNEKLLKIVELVKPYDEAEEDEYNERETHSSNEKFFDPKLFVLDRPLLSQIHAVIKKCGPEGITAQEIGRKIGLPKLEIRLLCRNLEKKKAVYTFMHDRGRQRVTKYIAKKFEKESDIRKKIFDERKKLLDLKLQQNAISDNVTKMYTNDKPNEISLIMEDSGLNNITVEIEQEKDAPEKKTNSNKDVIHVLKPMSCDDLKGDDSSYMTHRSLRRAITIIEAVKTATLIDDVHKLQKIIHESETNEDYSGKVDKKSILRLIHNLAKDGYVRSIRTVLKMGDQIKKLHFVCDPSITAEHTLVKNSIEQAKFKYFASKETFKSQQKSFEKQGKEINSVDKSVKELQQLCEKVDQTPMQFIPAIGRMYGLEPKFLRMKSLYTFLFYLVYDYQGQFSNNVDGPPIYHVEMGWKMFIPPLPQHTGIPEGWCLISDILLNMPLSILVRVFNITYKIEGLEVYLSDPIKQHYLIRHLSDKVRSAIMLKRRYIFAVHEVATKLSFMGLISFGPQKHKEKDQAFIFVHRYTCIRDTTISKPGYLHITEDLEYSKTDYFLKTLEDVESYWVDLEAICLHTPLGSFTSARGQSVTIEIIYQKPAMIEASRIKRFDEVSDDGNLPGDGRGAAGLDSALFSHLKRNWFWPSKNRNLNIYPVYEKNTETTENINNSYLQYLLQKNNPSAQEIPDRQKRLFRLHNLKRNVENLSGTANISTEKAVSPTGKKYKKRFRPADEKSQIPAKRRKPATIVRTINRKYTKKRKPYYDDKDKDALEKMSKLRVDWTTQEDSILLLCKVTSCLLNPHCTGMVVPYTCIRDFLHEKMPSISSNKTSRACQRRVRYMLLNPTTSSNVSVFLTEARQDKELMMLCQGPKPATTNTEIWSQMFRTVLNSLLSKFTLSVSDRCEKIDLPKTLDELHSNYHVIITGELPGHKPQHQHPRSITDIYEGVVYALIMCSLCSVGDKNNWSYILYKLYQQYPDSMLRTVVARLRRDQMVTKKKHIGKRIMQTLPLSSLPYHLSVNYHNTLLTQYQPKIYQECYNLLENLINNTDSKGVEVYKEEIAGFTAGIVSLMDKFLLTFELQIPDQIILFDKTLSDKQHSEIAKQMEEIESQEHAIKSSLLDDSFIENTNNIPSRELEDAQFSSHTATSSEEPPVKKQRVEIETSDNQTPSNDHDYACSSKLEKISNSSSSNVSFESASGLKGSRIALHMLRQVVKDEKVVLHSQDYFVINLCHIVCRLNDNVSKQLAIKRNDNLILSPAVISEIIDSQRRCVPNYVPSLECVYDLSDFDYIDKEFGKKLYDAIYEQKELGITRKHLWELFGNPDNGKRVEKHLNFMMEKWIVLRVGIACFQYVCYEFCKPWILSSYRIPKDMKSQVSDEMKQLTENSISQTRQEMLKAKDNLSEICIETNSTVIESNVTLKTSPINQEIVVKDNSEKNIKITHTEQFSNENVSKNSNEPITLHNKTSSKEMKLSIVDTGLSKNQDLEKPCNTEINSLSECLQKKPESKEIPETSYSIVLPQRKQPTCQKESSYRHRSSSRSESWERVQFIARSWRKPNGMLNHSMLNKLLSSILGHIMTFPGKTEQQICDHFMAALQPVQVLELIEILATAECVHRFFFKSSHVASLFSKPVKYDISCDESIDAACHVEATADAIVKFSQLSEVLVNDRTKIPRLFSKISQNSL